MLPPLYDGRSICHFDLFCIALMIHFHQRVVAFIRGAADRITDQDDPVSQVNGSKHCCKDANVGLRAGDDQAIGFSGSQKLKELWVGERGVSSTAAGGQSFASAGNSSNNAGSRRSRVASFQRM